MAHRVADPTGADVEVPEESHQRVLRITLLGYIAAVLLITQWPDPPDPGSLGWLQRALAWLHDNGLPGVVDLLVVEALANVVMFVPAVLLAIRAWRAADHPPERSSRAATWSRQSHGPSRPPGDITG